MTKMAHEIDIISSENKNKIVINDAANIYVFITLLMLDQLHDFGESDRSTEIKMDQTKRKILMNDVYSSTKNFMNEFETEGDLQNFRAFPIIYSDFYEIDEKIYKYENCDHLLSEEKYKIANELISLLGITKTNFDDLQEKLNPSNLSYFPNYSCNSIKNIFVHYLLLSGFISSGELVDSITITVDATKSRYEMSPILYNICEFIFGNDDKFNNIKLLNTIASKYDAAGTQSIETFLEQLESKKNERILILDKHIDMLYRSFLDPELTDQKKWNTINKDISRAENTLESLRTKSISTSNIHDINGSQGFEKEYSICYGKYLIIQYSLTLKYSILKLEITDDESDVINSFKSVKRANRQMFLRDLLEQLAIKTVSGFTKDPIMKSSMIISIINKSTFLNLKLQLNTVDFLDENEFIQQNWNTFVESKKDISSEDKKKIVSIGYENISDLEDKIKENYLKLSKSFSEKYKIRKDENISDMIPEMFKNIPKLYLNYKKKIKNLENFISILNQNGIRKSEIKTEIVVPLIKRWLDYDENELKSASEILTGKENEYIIEFFQRGISQTYIMKRIKENNLQNDKIKYLFPYKTIGDLSQIQECSNNFNKKGVNIFITFDRICAYISSLFNRTILEESDKKNNIFFNLKTFLYTSQKASMDIFKNNTESILNGQFRNFRNINTISDEQLQKIKSIRTNKRGENLQNLLEITYQEENPESNFLKRKRKFGKKI